ALEAARVFFPAYRVASRTQADEIQLNFDLIRVLGQDSRFQTWASRPEKWTPPNDPFWQVDPVAPYDAACPTPKKVAYLHDQIVALAPGTHRAALGLFGKAAWLRGYQAQMRNYAFKWEGEKRVELPYPYQEMKPEALLRELIRRFPDDPVREQGQILLAAYL